MGAIRFEPPYSGRLILSGDEILVFGVFESGKAVFCREGDQLMVSDDPIALDVTWDNVTQPIDTDTSEDG